MHTQITFLEPRFALLEAAQELVAALEQERDEAKARHLAAVPEPRPALRVVGANERPPAPSDRELARTATAPSGRRPWPGYGTTVDGPAPGSILCGHCRRRHPSVAVVKACAAARYAGLR